MRLFLISLFAETIVFGEAEDGVADPFRVRHMLEVEATCLSGRLYVDMSVIEEGVEWPTYFGGDILHKSNVHLGRRTIKEPVLFDVNDALCGYDPDVQVVVDELLEEECHDGEIVDGEEDACRGVTGCAGENLWHGLPEKPRDHDGRQCCKSCKEAEFENANPVSSEEENGLLIRFAVWEVIEVQHTTGGL